MCHFVPCVKKTLAIITAFYRDTVLCNEDFFLLTKLCFEWERQCLKLGTGKQRVSILLRKKSNLPRYFCDTVGYNVLLVHSSVLAVL
jgi:hypothetical protein